MFGIAWGIISITLMVAAGEGLRVGQQQKTETFGKDIMIVFAGRTSLQAGGVRAGRRLFWEITDYRFIAAGSARLPVRRSRNWATRRPSAAPSTAPR